MRITALIFLLGAGFQVSALEAYQHNQSTYYVYGEDGKWFADEYAAAKDGWPEIKSHHVFGNATAAQAFVKRHHGTRVHQSPFKRELRSETGATLWTVTNQWDWSWELKYTEWVKKELDSTWWKRHNIATDCADVVYSARWIFARNNGLPMANRTLTGSWFTHNSVRPEWEALPTAPEWDQDQRFMAALDYLLSKVFTHTLWQDSYPVAINATALLPGGHHLALDQDTGHTQFIYQIGTSPDQVPVLTLNSTVPRALRDMMEFVFFESIADPNGHAFLRMRWPKFDNGAPDLVAAEDMPHYSQEQFDPSFVRSPRESFWQEVFYRLNPRADFDRIAKKSLQQIYEAFHARIPVVEKGYEVCHANPCVEGTLEWEAWSTPTRDRRIGDTIDIFDKLSSFISDWSVVSGLLRTEVLRLNGWDHSLADIMNKWRAGIYSSDPNDQPEQRWGVQ